MDNQQTDYKEQITQGAEKQAYAFRESVISHCRLNSEIITPNLLKGDEGLAKFLIGGCCPQCWDLAFGDLATKAIPCRYCNQPIRLADFNGDYAEHDLFVSSHYFVCVACIRKFEHKQSDNEVKQ